MAAHERVLNALNFLTGEGVAYYPDGCDAQKGRAIEALITDYFSNGNNVSKDESDRSGNDTSSDDEIADTPVLAMSSPITPFQQMHRIIMKV